MKHLLLIGIALILCTFQSKAQIKANGLSGVNVTGVVAPASTLVFGNGNATGTNNVFIGQNAATANTTGNANAFVGQGTAVNNTSGYANSFFGAWTGALNTTGFANTFLGQYCGVANTTGVHNSFLGQGSGINNTIGGHNVFIGTSSGNGNTTGSGNTALGANAGFLLPGLFNATAIGNNAQSSASNTVILGGTGGSSVNVGIGTPAPAAHLHTVNAIDEHVIFSTTNNTASSESRFSVRTPNPITVYNDVKLMSFGTANATNLLNVSGSAPAISQSNMGALLTDGPIAIGMDGYENPGSIHFVNYVQDAGSVNQRAECMRINRTNGFVGVHTRLGVSSAGSGEPQALFHVNLTNPINTSLNMLTQGIRFEGLPAATGAHTQTVMIDANGNLAQGPGTVGPSNAWLLTGNSIVPTDFIGTLNYDDFRVRTNNIQRAQFTKDGNFDVGVAGSNNLAPTSVTSTAMGTNNMINNATSVIAVGTDNNIDNSSYSVAFGESNVIDANSISCQTTGNDNNINDADYSMTAGNNNNINMSTGAFSGGSFNNISNSTQVAVLGGGHTMDNTFASVITGEDNEMYNGHGCFMGGGHSYSDGTYNILLGNNLRAEPGAPTAMPTTPLPWNLIMAIGEQIHSDLDKSLSVGFTGNRTTVTTQRGLAVQLNPGALSTWSPTVNFEVDAAIAPSPGPMPTPSPIRSNIRFHNLPVMPGGVTYPAVVIDPATGELFQTISTGYSKPGKGGADTDFSDLYDENEALKDRLAQLEAQLSTYDEKFAQLERSLNQICESGCAGLSNKVSDALYQSIPNPSNNRVKINYFLSRNYNNANITVYSYDGREVNTYNLVPNQGDGSIDISLADIQSGVYLYRLIVDGKPVDVKKLQKQ